MTRTAKLVISGVLALAICLMLLLVMLNTAHGNAPTLRERNTITHFDHLAATPAQASHGG